MTPSDLNAGLEDRGIIPTQLARRIGVNYDTVKDWRSGRRTISPIAVSAVTQAFELFDLGRWGKGT